MPTPTFCLSTHAGFRCEHSGVCCSSGWPIPVDEALLVHLRSAIADGRLAPAGGPDRRAEAIVDDGNLSSGYAALLGVEPSGACSFHDRAGRRCVIQARLGHDFLPSACQHFPRVCLRDDDSVRVSLSHYCPTVVNALFDHQGPLSIVRAPDSLVRSIALEGLDARGALPPLLGPGMLMSRSDYQEWERQVVSALAGPGTAEAALAGIAAATERIRGWQPGGETLAETITAAFSKARDAKAAPDPVAARLAPGAVALDQIVRQSVPAPLAPASPPLDLPRLFEKHVAPSWASFAVPVRRYLAARAFGNWCAYQGRGLRSVVQSILAALAVVKVESARICGSAGRDLDARLLREAVRAADLLIVHLASREALARSFSEVENRLETGSGPAC